MGTRGLGTGNGGMVDVSMGNGGGDDEGRTSKETGSMEMIILQDD